MKRMIEVTNASGLKLNRILIAIDSILDIQEPTAGGCIIEVASGNKIICKESYDNIIKLICKMYDSTIETTLNIEKN